MNQFIELIIFGNILLEKKKEIKRAYHSPIFSLTKIIDSKCSCNVYFKIVTFYYHINVAQQ